jgi:hypothetical protein
MAGYSTSRTEAGSAIPDELRPLLGTAGAVGKQFALQGAPLLASLMTTSRPQHIPGLSPLERFGGNVISQQAGESPYLREAALTNLGAVMGGSVRREPEYRMGMGQFGDILSGGIRRTPEYGLGMGQLQQLVEGDIGESPVTQQAISALRAPLEQQFFETTLPTIQNQMALAGMGHSAALGDQIRKALGGAMGTFQKGITPLLQQEVGFRQQAVPTLLGMAESQVGRQERIAPQLLGMAESQVGRQERIAPQLLGLAESQVGRQQQGVPMLLDLAQRDMQQAVGFGGMERGIEEARGQAALQDLLRRQNIIEKGVFGPVQTVIPSGMGGAAVTTTGENRAPFMFGGSK